MRYTLELEDFGDPLYKAVHGNKVWVAKINLNGGKIRRTFIKPMIDYANANRHLSRGIYRYYFLDDGDYEVSYPLGHRLAKRYFLRVKDSVGIKINRDQICQSDI